MTQKGARGRDPVLVVASGLPKKGYDDYMTALLYNAMNYIILLFILFN